ncbi:LuxR C-terminal-related transcriptional regulator [Streptomyces sp. NPDC059193]|uniref:response regulator transcription factor n=1 Tax=Streptomyces sp. NPDC059193 TaxID=3346763 RepID=UPI0036C28CE6
MITVLPVSSDNELRALLRDELRGAADVTPIGEAWDEASARERIRVLLPDVAVVYADARIDGFALTRELRRGPGGPEVVIVGRPGPRIVADAVAAGASGVLAVDALHKDLARAVRYVAAGQAFFSAEMTSYVVCLVAHRPRAPQQPSAAVAEALTARQLEVLELLCTGLSNAEIADRLHLRVATVKTHVSEILTRLGAHNRVEAARMLFP